MPKLIQMKDKDGNLFPKTMSNAQVLFEGSSKSVSLSKDISSYGMLLITIGANPSYDSVTIPFITIGSLNGSSFDCMIISGYLARGSITVSPPRTIGINVREVSGWSANDVNIRKIVGINLI